MKKVRLGFKKLDPNAKIPSYAHEGDAGMDICALQDVTLPLYIPRLVHTGIAAEIPEGYELQVRPRSGLACKGVTVYNSPGTIDSKYRGEICVILTYINSEVVENYQNTTDLSGNMVMVSIGTRPKTHHEIKAGDKIAQLVLAPVTFATPVEVNELSETERGTNGFGSTGR
jgi:dUTP pyrophosphatase